MVEASAPGRPAPALPPAAPGDHEAKGRLREKFLDQMCAASRDVAFSVGNQAKRAHVFSVLGVYWPPKE